MVFALFKGCLSNDDAVATATTTVTTTNNTDKTTTTTVACCDDSWSSSDKYAGRLEGLAAQAQWDAVLALVDQSTGADWTDTAPLHVALQHRAPVHVVDGLIALSKDKLEQHVPEESTDAAGRTPLHIAVITGCPEEVVQRLLAGDNLVMPAVVRDHQGQTPLHAATASPVLKTKKQSFLGPNQMALDLWNKRRCISVLLEHYPEGALLQDTAGHTAVEYAQRAGLPKHTIHELQRAAAIYTPSMADPSAAASQQDLASLASSDVPLIVPSLSCRADSIRNSEATTAFLQKSLLLSDHTLPDDNDVSTLGDAEAELYHIEFEENIRVP